MSTSPSEVLMPATKVKKIKKPKVEDSMQSDALVLLAHECENMNREAAFAALPSLLESVDSNYIKLGGVLAVIRDHEWWKEAGYPTFSACLEQKFGLQYRKGAYLVQTYENLIGSGVAWEQVKELGWSKLRVVSSVINTENVGEWVAKAASLTVLQLYDVVREFKAAKLESGDTSSEVTPEDIAVTTTTMSFKLHPDQKESIKQALDKARKEVGTEFDAVALEAICLNYLAGGKVTTSAKAKTVKAPTLKGLMQASTAEAVLEAFGEVWPDYDVQVTMP